MKKLAIIGAQRMAKNYAINAREMGVETFCFAWPKGAVAKDFVDHFYPISIFETTEIVAICQRECIDGVVSTSELTIPIAAHVATVLGLNGISEDVACVITDKYRNREASKDIVGLHHPKYAKISSVEEAMSLDFSFPLILKPAAEGGKRGVSVAKSPEELDAAFSYARGEAKTGEPIIIEEYVAGGHEYSVETLSYAGQHKVIQVTEKISSGPPHCVELGHIQPARISSLMRVKIESILSKALSAVGYTNGPCHTEIKIVDDEIWLIEFNARPGGDFISFPLINLSTGYPYLKGAIQIALGDFEFPKEFNSYAAGVLFVTEQSRYLAPLFQNCQKYDWCWRKNEIGPLVSLAHNNCDNTNYFIWVTQSGLPIELSEYIKVAV